MAAFVPVRAKVLIQIGDDVPVEVAQIEIPMNLEITHTPKSQPISLTDLLTGGVSS